MHAPFIDATGILKSSDDELTAEQAQFELFDVDLNLCKGVDAMRFAVIMRNPSNDWPSDEWPHARNTEESVHMTPDGATRHCCIACFCSVFTKSHDQKIYLVFN